MFSERLVLIEIEIGCSISYDEKEEWEWELTEAWAQGNSLRQKGHVTSWLSKPIKTLQACSRG